MEPSSKEFEPSENIKLDDTRLVLVSRVAGESSWMNQRLGIPEQSNNNGAESNGVLVDDVVLKFYAGTENAVKPLDVIDVIGIYEHHERHPIIYVCWSGEPVYAKFETQLDSAKISNARGVVLSQLTLILEGDEEAAQLLLLSLLSSVYASFFIFQNLCINYLTVLYGSCHSL